ncbi:PQQ-binding-like beta-propeller repeat protein [Streptomyces sp. NPDC079189]|uniref:hypothetical protein n=1 Tax=Streptomyces sp. NPDC079189 TaxID=3154514 RepID=UPI003437BFFF
MAQPPGRQPPQGSFGAPYDPPPEPYPAVSAARIRLRAAAWSGRSQLVGGTDDYATKCGGDLLTEGKNLHNCLGVAAADRTVYLATEPAASDLTPTNEVVAFDLNTGQAKWKAAAPAGQTLMPMRVEGGRLLMYLAAGKNKGGGIASLPPTGGTPQMVLRHPAAAATVERGFFDSRVVYQNGRSFLMHARISGIDDEDEKSMKSMAGFGS